LHAERGFPRQTGAGKTVYIGVMHGNMPHSGALPASWDLKGGCRYPPECVKRAVGLQLPRYNANDALHISYSLGDGFPVANVSSQRCSTVLDHPQLTTRLSLASLQNFGSRPPPAAYSRCINWYHGLC
jgi:hypothetical protein